MNKEQMEAELDKVGLAVGTLVAEELSRTMPQDLAMKYDEEVATPMPGAQMRVIAAVLKAILPRSRQLGPCEAAVLLGDLSGVLVDVYKLDERSDIVTPIRLLLHAAIDHTKFCLQDNEMLHKLGLKAYSSNEGEGYKIEEVFDVGPNVKVIKASGRTKADLAALIKSLIENDPEEKSDDDQVDR